MGVRIKQVEFRGNVRVFIVSLIMRCLYEVGVLKAAGFHCTMLIHFITKYT